MRVDHQGSGEDDDLTDQIRALERERLRALVAKDMAAADALHADDFQLITPSGSSMSKTAYLGAVAAGVLDYRSWEAGPIEVRIYGSAAAIRYQSQLEIVARGKHLAPMPHWHTDTYELRDGRWQVVWSQATRVQ